LLYENVFCGALELTVFRCWIFFKMLQVVKVLPCFV
jgi:hypothetical protein